MSKATKIRKKRKRQYTDKQRAAALAAIDFNSGDVERTANQLEIPYTTLMDWSKGRGIHPQVATEIRDEKKADLSDCLETLARLLAEAAPEKIKGASLQQVGVVLGIVIERMKLLRGEATSIAGKEEMTDGELAERIQRLAERYQAGEIEASGQNGTLQLVPKEEEIVGTIQGTADPSILQQS